MKYDIEALKRKTIVKYPFFGSVVANVNYKEDQSVLTAGTDGETIYYNPNFLEELSLEEQIFIFAHEVCHIAFNHILRSEGKDQKLWNIATDAVINQFFKKDGLPLVNGAVAIADAINYDANQLYEHLLQEKKQNKQDNQQTEKKQSGNSRKQGNIQQNNSSLPINNKEKDDLSNDDVGHDTHKMWSDAVKKYKKQQFDNEKKDEIKQKQDEIEKMGEKETFKKNKEQYKKQLEELKELINKQVSQAGIKTNSKNIILDNIGYAKPLLDWRYILRETINYEVDWSYKNATIEEGVVTANLEEQPLPETEILLDTSDSINEVLLKNFLRECKNLLQHTKLKVGCFDTKFYGFHEIRTEEDIENMCFEGRGGTDFNVAVNAFSRRVENKIIFTDGKAPMPDMPLDAIWVIFGNEQINPKGGKVINITGEDLDRLCDLKIIDNENIKRNF